MEAARVERASDANFVIKTDDRMTTCKLIPPLPTKQYDGRVGRD